jgi:transglutaminase-like putative cysteine protease
MLELSFILVMATIYTYAITSSVMAATVVRLPAATLFLLCAVPAVAFCAVFLNRYTALGVLALILLSALFIYLDLRENDFEAEWFAALVTNVDALIRFARGFEPYRRAFALPFTLAISVPLALFAAAFVRFRAGFYALTIVGAAVIGIQSFMNYNGSDAATLLLVFCFIVLFTREMNRFASAKGSSGRDAKLSTLIMPAALALVLISYIIPKPRLFPDGFNLINSLRNSLWAVEDFFYEATGPKVFSFQTAGISGVDSPSRLGGSLLSNSRHIMDVYSDERVYMSASVKDTYTGDSWINQQDNQDWIAEEGENDWFDTSIYHNSRRAMLDRYMRYLEREKKYLSVTMAGPRVNYLFSPPFQDHMWFPGEADVTVGDFGVLTVPGALPRGTSYVQEYLSWDYDDPKLMALLRVLTVENSYEPPNSVFFAQEGTWWDNVQASVLAEYAIATASGTAEPAADGVRRRLPTRDRSAMPPYLKMCLSLPENLPERVKNLAEDVVGDAYNDYDRMKALEDFLQTYTYTTTPELMPEDADFVDHFLFTGKEGYCTSYASALAVMGRAIGVPTRYVEGYIMPESPAEGGGYVITNNNAHAWVEAYMRGFGWVPFEATAPFTYGFYHNETPLTLAASGETFVDDDYLYYLQMMELQEAMISAYALEAMYSGSTGESAAATILSTQNLTAVTVTLAALFVLFVLFQILRVNSGARRLGGMSNREAVLAYYSRILMTAKAYGLPIMPYETAAAYGRRVSGKLPPVVSIFPLMQKTTMTDLAEIFSRAAYGKGEITDKEKEMMKASFEELLGMYPSYGMKKPMFYINRYLLMRF